MQGKRKMNGHTILLLITVGLFIVLYAGAVSPMAARDFRTSRHS